MIEEERIRAVEALGKREGITFIRYQGANRSKALFWDASHKNRAVVLVATLTDNRGRQPHPCPETSLPQYWYTMEENQKKFLEEEKGGYLILVLAANAEACVIPADELLRGIEQGKVRTHFAEGKKPAWTIILEKRGEHGLVWNMDKNESKVLWNNAASNRRLSWGNP